MKKLILLSLLFTFTGCSLEKTFCEPLITQSTIRDHFYTETEEGRHLLFVTDANYNIYNWSVESIFEIEDILELKAKTQSFQNSQEIVFILYCESGQLIDIKK